jgi:hypothetical protein
MNTQENNKLIAEFMGYENVGTLNNPMYDYYDNYFQDGSYVPHELCYHKSWDWLMPVVEKIECTPIDNDDNSDNFFNVMIEVFECNINGGDICICEMKDTKREATYNAVVEFINQYNKNQ